ncbi:Bacteriophage head to tail connecting protein [Aminobacter sp. MSH1]|uniref:portal protein n=1 Tax=Aminobacter sp. MSH1 TaxID=374606 RepID=UPI000D332099|nr:portal protein [Aminobacter sp. MSH1]AWC25603.1 Bacteriophage head to tail connecting protein [Aminobacter sp. MSH1]
MALSPAIQTVIENGNRLFTERVGLLCLWQELAEHFYYERASFTSPMTMGADYASGSFSSDGALYRREMGNLFQPMMRPQDFFSIKALDDARNKDGDARGWLEYATKLQRSVMYSTGAQLYRATVAGDHDFVTFGQGVVEVCAAPDRRNLFYRNWHLRDCAWSQDFKGAVTDIHRNDTSTLSNLVAKFGDKVPEALRKDAEKNPYATAKVRHVVVPSNAYDVGYKVRADQPYVSLWVMPDHGEVLENIPRTYRGYVIPRGLSVDGTQYGASPFTSIVLADGRTSQTIERILLEAGEKAVDPAMVATLDAVRGDIGLYAGGITWIDAEYDERLGEALRPVNSDPSSLPFGQDMAERFAMRQRLGFMLDKISLPETSGKTAYEVRKIVEQQMRSQIPIFGPIEAEYSEPLCSETFAVMRSLGAFPANEIPPSLQGAGVEFSFKSPITDLEGDTLKAKLSEGMEIISAGASFDPTVAKLANPMEIVKDMLRRIGWPESWLNDEKRLAAAVEQMQQEQQAAAMAADVGGAAEVANKAAPMVKALAGAA